MQSTYTPEQEEIFKCTPLDTTILSACGFEPCEPWENYDVKHGVTPPLLKREPFNSDGLYEWFGYKADSQGNKWYVVKTLPTSELMYLFQRQIEVKTVYDLITVYENSTNEKLISEPYSPL